MYIDLADRPGDLDLFPGSRPQGLPGPVKLPALDRLDDCPEGPVWLYMQGLRMHSLIEQVIAEHFYPLDFIRARHWEWTLQPGVQHAGTERSASSGTTPSASRRIRSMRPSSMVCTWMWRRGSGQSCTHSVAHRGPQEKTANRPGSE